MTPIFDDTWRSETTDEIVHKLLLRLDSDFDRWVARRKAQALKLAKDPGELAADFEHLINYAASQVMITDDAMHRGYSRIADYFYDCGKTPPDGWLAFADDVLRDLQDSSDSLRLTHTLRDIAPVPTGANQ